MRRSLSLLVTLLVAAGCGMPAGSGSVPPASDGRAAPSPAGTPQPAGRTAAGATGTPGATPAATGTAARAAFLSHVFTDVRDGKTFTLGGFEGKQVFVIGMAVW